MHIQYVNEVGRDQIAGRLAAEITRIAHRIGLAGVAIEAEYFDLVVALFECVKRMGKLTPSENREAIRSSSNLPRLRLRLRPVWADESQLN